jgi:hypothetical protein
LHKTPRLLPTTGSLVPWRPGCEYFLNSNFITKVAGAITDVKMS